MPPRFFHPHAVGESESIALSREESRHLARVLRLSEGDETFVFDTEGAEFRARVMRASPHGAELSIVERLGARSAPLPELTLIIAHLKSDPMSLMVQKATELGVARIAPFVSRRSMDVNDEGDIARLRRWERVSLAACKQCGRAKPIEIEPTRSFVDAIGSRSNAGPCFIAWEGRDAPPLYQAARGASELISCALAIGPEGGFADDEVKAARDSGFAPVTLGPHILRAETAALAGAAILLNAAMGYSSDE